MSSVSSRSLPALPGDEIVITGVSGKYPSSDNVSEFSYNLYNKIDMVNDKETRWKHVDADIPKRMGKLNTLEKFDATFFGVHKKQSKTMDPQSRILIETAYEAIIDAGINPTVLRGSNTGVFVGACFSESDKVLLYEKNPEGGMGITGGSRAMFANRISYSLGLQGPSFLVDTACSSSMYALDCAFASMKNGQCDAALVGGSNIILHPNITREFYKLGVLAPDGYCRPFSNDASGYTRSEAISVIFLQKAKDAKRIYASLLYTKTNCDGYKNEGITFPSRVVQEKLMKEFYDEINIHPNTISYLEAHSTGTVVGDPEECHAIDNVLCKSRSTPLLVGSVKSNMGHSESSSGVCSITKVILALESGIVAPNINFKEIRKIPSLVENRLKVCVEPTKLDGPLVGINSFGFGGANAHALLCGNQKEKKNGGCPTDTLPRIVNWCGRTQEAVDAVMDDIRSKPLDTEFIGLLHGIQSSPIPGNNYRGFGLFAHKEKENAVCLLKDTQYFTGIQRPIVWVFSGMGSQWLKMGSSLMQIPLFRESIESSHAILTPYGLDLKSIITSDDPKVIQNILNTFVGIAAIQIALVDILKTLELKSDYIVGHSVGEIGCAYADGCFTAEQMLLASYYRGLVSLQSQPKLIRGSMAAIGLGYQDLKDKLIPGIEIACHNGPHSSTISGPEQLVNEYVADMQKNGIFAKAVPSSNIAYHSSYITELGPKLLEELKKIIPKPQKRSQKWLSSSVPQSEWDLFENQLSSAEYHTNNLLSPVLFEEVTEILPKDSLLIEIAPHGLLQAIFKKSMPDSLYIPLTNRTASSNAIFFFNSLGRLFVNGLQIPISRLYPPVSFPVSRGTANISSLIKWDHSEDHFVAKYGFKKGIYCGGERSVLIDLKESEFEYIEGHRIDGRCLIPATAYLRLVWESLSTFMMNDVSKMNVEFEDVRFIRATAIKPGQSIELLVIIQSGTGQFEITEMGSLVVTGVIRSIEQPEPITTLPKLPESTFPILNNKDFYKELKLRGYHYDGEFKSVMEVRGDGLYGKVKWNNNWVPFLDCMLQINIIGRDTRNIMLPTRIHKLRINESEHMKMVSEMDPNNIAFDVQVCPELGILVTGGVELTLMKANTVSRRKAPGVPILESYQFVSHLPAPKLSKTEAIRMIVQIVTENNLSQKQRLIEIECGDQSPLIEHFGTAFKDIPVIVPELILLSKSVLTIPNVLVDSANLQTYKDCSVILGSGLLSKSCAITEIAASMSPSGFLVSREKNAISIDLSTVSTEFRVLAVIPTEEEFLVVLNRVLQNDTNEPAIIRVSSDDYQYKWLLDLQKSIKNDEAVIVVAQNDPLSGTLGLINCIRREPNGSRIKMVFIDDVTAPPFDYKIPFYRSQLNHQLAINVYRDGKWGSYRHFILNQLPLIKPRTDHCICNLLTPGDLTTFKWSQGLIDSITYGNVVNVHYNALNFRDVMLATGRISMELFAKGNCRQELSLGFEFSGINQRGERVMGTSSSACMGTQVVNAHLTWIIPDSWTLRQAATVPVVYATVYLALFMKNPIKNGKSILIHAGSGGVGLAAIRVALAYGMNVFTTVSTPQKRQYLVDLFPQLKDSHIGNSRDCSFEKMIQMQTGGRGVDYVLNSLSEEKLQASVRCLAEGGTFLEIGKFDMANDSKIGLGHFMKNITFCSVMADRIIDGRPEDAYELYELINRDLRSGIIQPLDSTVFDVDDVEKAYRYLSTGKHVGKVLIKMRDNEKSIESVPIKVVPKVLCDSYMVYIVVGGLGGFGLELTDWLVLRGARKIVLSSSRGISNSYQQYRLRIWESYGCQIFISTSDISTQKGCKQLLNDSLSMGPIGGLFNLAAVLRDSILENQTPGKFFECIAPKAVSTKYLDELTRKMCPELKYFVVFSSISCGRGNAGQSNYGMANSIMERIVEQRNIDGFSGKAIQWGAIGEVGLVADMTENKIDLEIGGTIQQRITSCLAELDTLITTPEPIVGCMVVAEKRVGSLAKTSAIEAILNIFGIRDIRSVSMTTSLAEMGMDSLMMVEIKQTLEREFETFLSTDELRSLTFTKLEQLTNSEIRPVSTKPKQINHMVNLLVDSMGNNSQRDLPIVRLKSMDDSSDFNSCILIVPGIEGVANDIWRTVSSKLQIPVFFLQFTCSFNKDTISDIINTYFKHILNDLFNKTKNFYMIGYSYGSVIALEITRLLERYNKISKLILIDGSPASIKSMFAMNIHDKQIYDTVLTHLAKNIFPPDIVDKDVKIQLNTCNSNEEKLDKFLEISKSILPISKDDFRKIIVGIINRLKAIENMEYLNIVAKIETDVRLIRATISSFKDLPNDFGLSKCVMKTVDVDCIEGDHNTILMSTQLEELINKYCN